jgi:hypothetical protein
MLDQISAKHRPVDVVEIVALKKTSTFRLLPKGEAVKEASGIGVRQIFITFYQNLDRSD